MPTEKLESLITAAARYRLQKKTRKLAAAANIHGPDEALYQAIAEALGYRYNKLPMRVLAQRLPLKSLLRLKPIDREAQLFGMAAFIDLDHFIETPDPKTRLYLKKLWDSWWKERGLLEPSNERRPAWNLTGTRPLNHPQRRLGALASIINTWPTLSEIIHQPDLNTALGVKKIKAYFASLEHSFWNRHYTLGSKPADKKMSLVGRDRVEDILGNVLFPWLILNHPDYWNQYIQSSGSQVNEKLRRAVLRLFGNESNPDIDPRKWVKNYYAQQALLQIYADFCLEDSTECDECPFTKQLSQW